MIKAIAIDDEPLALNVIRTFCEEVDFIDLEHSFTKANEALRYLQNYPVDLVFLDIRMPSMNGLKLAKAIPQSTLVVFTTAYSDYAVESYEVNAIDYLLKPIGRKRFMQTLNKALELHKLIHQNKKVGAKELFIRADAQLVKVSLSDITCIEGLADYLKICLHEKKTIVVRMTMKEMLEKLPQEEFVRVHRSFIVPKSKIKALKNKSLLLSEREIPIGNTYLVTVKKLFDAT